MFKEEKKIGWSLIACHSAPCGTKLIRCGEPAASTVPKITAQAKRTFPAAPSLLSPTDPTLRANPFSKVTIDPISLTYIVLWARGCSPAAVISTQKSIFLPSFQGL